MKSINAILRKLTFDDLHDWAGETILNRGKGYVKRVDQLSCTEDNTLVAWVIGSKRYATSARVDEAGDLEYFCTCPYSWGPCKHTVAVILAAAEQVKRKETISLLDEDNELSQALFDDSSEEDNEWENDEPIHSPASRRTKAQTEVAEILVNKSGGALLDLLIDLSGRFPDVKKHIVETEQIASGQVDERTEEKSQGAMGCHRWPAVSGLLACRAFTESGDQGIPGGKRPETPWKSESTIFSYPTDSLSKAIVNDFQ